MSEAGRRIGSGYCRIRTSHKAFEIERGGQDGLPTPFIADRVCACVYKGISSCRNDARSCRSKGPLVNVKPVASARIVELNRVWMILR